MSLWKAIAHGKEHRKPYRGAQAFDSSCRPHGGCPYCESGRQHNTEKWKQIAEDTREEYFNSWEDDFAFYQIAKEKEAEREREWTIHMYNLLDDYEYPNLC